MLFSKLKRRVDGTFELSNFKGATLLPDRPDSMDNFLERQNSSASHHSVTRAELERIGLKFERSIRLFLDDCATLLDDVASERATMYKL